MGIKISELTTTTATGTTLDAVEWEINNAGTTEKITRKKLLGNYKSYVATLKQSATNAPDATVLENTLGGTVVWARVGLGRYTATLTGGFPGSEKVVVKTSASRFDNFVDFKLIEILAQRTDDNTIHLANLKNSSSEDGILSNDAIEIRVYE